MNQSEFQEFDFWITKAVEDKETGEKRWAMTSSDTEEDLYQDEMTIELYRSFVRRIEDNSPAPEPYQSENWKGGMPYMSVSHYSDGNGANVPGDIQAVYIDGNRLKSKGIFADNELGNACFRAVYESVQKVKSGAEDFRPVRVSIGFLDFKHKHKSNGSVFERKSIDDVCSQCLEEKALGTGKGLIFLDGQLIHKALTRVPVNPRTSMEVERSMTTKKEDAASIVGEELAEEIEERETSVQKALVVKSEDETSEAVEEVTEETKIYSLAESIGENDGNVTVSNVFGALSDLVWEMASNGADQESYAAVVGEARDMMLRSLFVMETKSLSVAPKAEEAVEVSPLDAAYATLKSKLSGISKEDLANLKELDQEWQEFAQEFADAIRNQFTEVEVEEAPAVEEKSEDVAEMIKAEIQKAIQPLVDSLAIQKAQEEQAPVVQRGYTGPALVVNDPATHGSQGERPQPKITPLSRMINRTVGLEENHLRPGAMVKDTGKA